jgi:hypothetical protein
MYKDSLFQLIRNEDVILWAGAGLSLYAGYPSGKSLRDELCNSLSPSEIQALDTNLNLPDFAEEIYRLKGTKNPILQILKRIFKNKLPDTIEFHEKLAQIPHIQTIITTNFDDLFEKAYGGKCEILTKSKDIPYINQSKTQVFKVHGDLNDPDSIIITKSDYNNFFRFDTEENVFWTKIKELISTKSLMFLGYNLEDPNVSVIFDKIFDVLGTHKKEMFLVAPNLPSQKHNDLIRKGINYIDIKAEDLINELLENLEENIIKDFQDGRVNPETLRRFLSIHGLRPYLGSNENSYTLDSFKPIDSSIEGKMNLKIKNEEEFLKEFQEFVEGRKFGEFKIPEDKLIDVKLYYEGIKIPQPAEKARILIKSEPTYTISIDIRFESGFEMTRIPIEIYSSKSAAEIRAQLNNAKLFVHFDLSNPPKSKINFSYQHNERFRNVKEEIEYYNFLKHLGKGEQFTIYQKEKEPISFSFPYSESLEKEAEALLDHFNNLLIIENYFNVSFRNIPMSSITTQTIKQVRNISKIAKGKSLDYESEEEMRFELKDLSEETLKQFEKINETKLEITAVHQITEEIEIYGQNINLGYKQIQLIDSYVINLSALLKKEVNTVRLKSSSNRIKVTYLSAPTLE